MIEFKGMPGPWVSNEFSQRIHTTDDVTIARCEPHSTDMAMANARLIAAAPELLAAISELMKIETADIGMDDFPDDDSVGAYQDENGNVKDLRLTFGHIRRARAAIAKACLLYTSDAADE
mgnify:CR=1 FL=1